VKPVRFIRGNPSLSAGSGLLLLVILAAAFAPAVAPHSPVDPSGIRFEMPSVDHWLGTDYLGRDVLSRVIHGARVSLSVAFPSVALALLLGGTLGIVAGFFGGWVDETVMRILDMFFAFPVILLAITIVAVFGASIPTLILTIGVVYTPRFARVSRAPVLAVKQLEFVEAAHGLGASSARTLFAHVVPNANSPVLVEVSLSLARALFTEAALSFLGLGPPPPNPTWGSMIGNSRQYLEIAPWSVLGPGIAITIAVISFVLLGNGLRRTFGNS
jgi:peptide/nickel transport system permease protein